MLPEPETICDLGFIFYQEALANLKIHMSHRLVQMVILLKRQQERDNELYLADTHVVCLAR